MDVKFYHSLSDEQKKLYRELAGEGWKPPKDDWKEVNYKFRIEGLEKISKLMKCKPKYKRNKTW